MRTITVFAVFVISFYSIFPLSAQGSGYALSLSPQFGFVYGQAEEIVYPSPPGKYKAEKLSQLLWDMKPVLYYGLSLDFSRANPLEKWGGFAKLSLKNGIPGISGNIENRDWMSVENDALTHYSIHDNDARELFLFDLSAGFSLPLSGAFLLKTAVSVSYMRFSFSGMYGMGTYAREVNAYSGIYYPITDNPILKPFTKDDGFNGKVINYTQDWLAVTSGLSLAYYFLHYFLVELSFQISPFILCAALDEHLVQPKTIQYRDYLQNGLFLEPAFRFAFAANKWLEFSVGCSWRHIAVPPGTSYQRSYGRGNYLLQDSESGAGLSMLDTGLCVTIRL